MAAHACALTIRAGFAEFGRVAALILVFRGLHGFTRLRLAPSRPACFNPTNYLIDSRRPLHVSQAFHMVNSFQFTRSARLILATDQREWLDMLNF